MGALRRAAWWPWWSLHCSSHFSGRIGRRALAPGAYRAIVRATDAAGNRSAAATVRFTVLHG
jgi:hypothetical protein